MPRRACEPVDRPGDATVLTLTLDTLIALRHQATVPADPIEGRGPWAGAFRAATRGQGLEVDDLRPYQPGDDLRHIDWKTSARRGEPYTRLYREERDHALSVVLDLRDTLFTGSRQLRATGATLLALRCVWQAARLGSRVALVVFDAGGVHLSSAARGERGALRACALAHDRYAQRLSAIAATAPTGVVAPALSVLIDRLLMEGRRLGSVQLISGLDDALLDNRSQAAFADELRRLALAAPLRVTLIEDAIERTPLPPGTYRYLGRAGIERVRIDRRMRQRYTDVLQGRRRTLEALCRRQGAVFDTAWPATPVDGR